MDERCKVSTGDFSCDAAGHNLLLTQHDHIDDDAAHIDNYRAVALAEGFATGTEAEVISAWQYLADHRELLNSLQGWFGRRVAELIEQGVIHAGDAEKSA